METIITLLFGAIIYGVIVKLILNSEPRSGSFSKVVWFLLWVLTLSFIFSSSSSPDNSGGSNSWTNGDCDDDYCDNFDTFESDYDNYDFMEDYDD